MTSTRAEHELLLCISRRDLDERREAELHRLLSGPLDWTYLISTARRHGLIPLLYRHLNSTSNDVPSTHLAALKQESIGNCQSVLTLLGRLAALLQLFNQHDIPVLVFKGPILAEVAYGENGLRKAGDVDVLIHRENFHRAKKLLESIEYQMVPELTSAQQEAHLKFHCEIQFVRDDGFTVLDLHWSLTPKAFPFALNTEDVFARSREMAIGGQPFRTFGLEDLILFQCMHGGKHYWSRLEWIASLAEIIRREDCDWNRVIQSARTARGMKMLALGLRLAERVGDVELPADAMRAVDPNDAMRHLAAETLAMIFDEPELEFTSARAVKKNFQIMDRKSDAFASMLRMIFVPTISDWRSVTLPVALHPLYYGYRPFRLMGSYATKLTRRVFSAASPTGSISSRSVKEPLTGGLID